MTKEEILSHPARFLSEGQRRSFFEEGYVCLPSFVPAALLSHMQAAADELIERSRSVAASADEWVVGSGHSSAAPRLRRVYRVTDHAAAFWEYAADSRLPDVVADLVGPNVKFREAYINYKSAGSGDPVEWHQDLPFLPHTNRAVVTSLTYLSDVTDDMGPFMVIPGSHRGELFEHYDEAGRWSGRIAAADLARVRVDSAVRFTGPAGTVVLMDSSAVHGSFGNRSAHSRPVLIVGYAAADAIAYTRTPPSQTASQTHRIVRGEPARFAHHEPMRMRLPPDWSQSYSSIFESQQGEERSARTAG
jgi:ectoine hydroxylase-related dioxygenase (phytanoyl-CoA dioxygenase family)